MARFLFVGATGAVGVEQARCLDARRFALAGPRPLASTRSAGKIMRFNHSPVPVEEMIDDSFGRRSCAVLVG
jgi:aspartate-semialdehyde dehydrogenase